MSKICPKCKRPQKDPSILACDKCDDAFYVEATDLIKTFTREELKILAGFIFKDWRVYILFGLLVVAGVGALYWQVHERINNQIQKLQISASNQVAIAYSTATNQIASKFQDFAIQASNQIAEAYSSVTNQIAEEFQTPRIKQTVEDVAKGEAKSILQSEVRPTVEGFRADAEFLRLATQARAYDFKAYLQLIELGTQTNANAKYANQIVSEIDRSLDSDRNGLSHRIFVTQLGTNSYSGPFSPDEIALRFLETETNSSSFIREAFVNTVHEMHQPLFLFRLIKMFTNETDLAVADRLTVAISDLTKEDFHPRDFDRIQIWWHSNEHNFTNWPFAEFHQGLRELDESRFAAAAKTFQQVLKVDPSADLSRALAIVTLLKIGETNDVTELTKEFKIPRWAEWVAAYTELDTGNVSNATVHIAEFIKRNPLIPLKPREGVGLWRKIDWQLLHKLTDTEKP